MLLRIVPTALTYRYHVQLRMPARLLSETCGVRNPICTSLGTLAVLHCLRDGASLCTRVKLRAACETGFTVGLGFGAKAPGSKSYVIPTRIPLQVCVHRCARPLVPCTSCHLYVLASSDRLCQRVRRGRTHRVAAAPHTARKSTLRALCEPHPQVLRHACQFRTACEKGFGW